MTYEVNETRIAKAVKDSLQIRHGQRGALNAERCIADCARAELSPVKFDAAATLAVGNAMYAATVALGKDKSRASQNKTIVLVARHWKVIEASLAVFWRENETGRAQANLIAFQIARRIKDKENPTEPAKFRAMPENEVTKLCNGIILKAVKAINKPKTKEPVTADGLRDAVYNSITRFDAFVKDRQATAVFVKGLPAWLATYYAASDKPARKTNKPQGK